MRLVSILAIAVALTACGESGAQAPAAKGGPLETAAANGAAYGQKPAFPGQTRAPLQKLGVAFDVVTVASGLDDPWGLTWLPDGRMLVTEKPGRLRIVTPDGKMGRPIDGVPEVYSEGQGGLLDVALSPAYEKDHLIYLSYAENGPNGTNGTAVGRGELVQAADGDHLRNFTRIYQQQPKLASRLHFGSRLVFAPDGTLFITQGERSIIPGRMQAQQMSSLLGKLVRINPDGSIPADNPFPAKLAVVPQIWSYGHRNIQGAAINPATGKLWTIEYGAKGGDEINQPEAGKDYGWPTITYGTEYSGAKIGEGITQKAGMEQPLYYWDPTSAPSGLAFYNASLFPAWKGSLFFGSHNPSYVGRLSLDGTKVVGEERLLEDFGAQIRDVRVGPDGAIYLLSDDPGGRILKLVPKG